MAIATAMAVLAAVTAAVGSVASGVAEKNRSDFEAADQRQRAVREIEISAQEEEDFRRKASFDAATRRANKGGSGVIQSTGSPLLGSADFAAETEINALRIRSGGTTKASRLETQAQLTASAGKAAKTRGLFRAGSSLLSGGSKLFK